MKEARQENLYKAFIIIFEKLGLTDQQTPNGASLRILEAHVREHYYAHTVQEIILAFDMAVSGQFEDYELDLNFYGQMFSCAYFSKVMNVYRKWAADEYKQIEHKLPHLIPIETKRVEISWEEMIETEYQYFLANYKGEGGQNWLQWETYASQFYDQLVKDGYIEADAYKEKIDSAKLFLLSRLQKQYAVVNLNTKLDETTGSPDARKIKENNIQAKINELRNGGRESEVNLKAKQSIVFKLFCVASKNGLKNLYIKTQNP